MSKRNVVAKRKNRLSIEPLEPRRLLDVSGVWQEMGFRSASGGGMTYHPYFFDDDYFKSETDGRGNRAMAIDQQGYPVVAHERVQWIAPSTVYAPPAIIVQRYNGFEWITLGGEAGVYGPVGGGVDPAVAIDFKGQPYVAFLSGSEIYLKYFDGAAWQTMDGGSGNVSNDSVKNAEPDVVIGTDGLPIVAYTAYDATGNDMDIVVKKWNGNRWVELTNGLEFGEAQGVSASLYGDGVSNDIYDSKNPSITIDKSGYPILAWSSETYANNNEIYIRRWTGGEWVEIGTDSASGPPGKFGPEDTVPSRGISNDDTMSLEPVVRVTDDNTIIVAWIDYQDYSNRTNAGIYLKKYEQGAASPVWEEYSLGSATGHGITPVPGMTFQNLSMDVGPHATDPSGEWTPVLAWSSLATGAEPWVARFNPGTSTWEFLVGDGADPLITEPLDGPHPWADFVIAGVTPDATGWMNIYANLPVVGIDPTTGHEILVYSNREIYFPDWEVYAQQYRANSDYFEIRDLDETRTVNISVAWASNPGTPTGDLIVSLLDGDGAAVRTSLGGQMLSVTPTAYVDPVGGDTRGLVRLKLEGQTWGEQNYILTVDQGGADQVVDEIEPNEVYLDRQIIRSTSGNQEARTVKIGSPAGPEKAGINNQWIEMGRGSLTRGGLDNSPLPSIGPIMATSYDGSPIMAYIDSNRRGDAWLEVKIFDQQARDEYGQPGTWINLTENVPLTSSVIDGALTWGAQGFGLTGIGDPVTKVIDVSCDPTFLNSLNGKVFVAVTDGTCIDVYEAKYGADPTRPNGYSQLTLIGGDHAVTAPAGGKIVWVSVQAGPDGEVALAWEWFNPNGYPAAVGSSGTRPRLGAGDVYLRLWDPTANGGSGDWIEMGAGSSANPNANGVGGMTNDGFSRYPDLAFIPTPADPPGTGANKKGSYVLAWSYGSWDSTAGEPSPAQEPEPRFTSGFESYGIKVAWFDKNTQTWSTNIVDSAGPYTLYTWNKTDVIGAYQARRKWPSITIGDTGLPFVSWTLELYTYSVQDLSKDNPDAGSYYYLCSWIEGWQCYYQGYWSPRVAPGHKWEVGTSVSHQGQEQSRVSGGEITEDPLMSMAVGNAGQMPIVTWQVLDIDASNTQDDPSRTKIPHNRGSVTLIDEVGEATYYDIWRPNGEAGWFYSASEQRQIFVRRYNESASTWEQLNSITGIAELGEFTSATGNPYHGVDQWWSSGFWPSIALMTNPTAQYADPVIGWLNDSESTVYVRGYTPNSRLPILEVHETLGADDAVLNFGLSHIGVPTLWTYLTISNSGNGALTILDFKVPSGFEYTLVDENGSTALLDELNSGGIVLSPSEFFTMRVRFTPDMDDAGAHYEMMEIVSTDPLHPNYPLLLMGVGTNGAVIKINETAGVTNDLVLPFGFVEKGEERQITFAIQNTGVDPLKLERIFAGLPGIFSVGAYPSEIAAGATATITVTFRPQTEKKQPVYDTLAIYSNDVVTPRVFIQLIGNAPALTDVSGTRLTSGSEVYPTINNDYVAYVRTSTYSTDAEPDGNIYLFNRATQTELATPIGTGHDPHMWDDWVVFSGGLYDITNTKLYTFSGIPGYTVSNVRHLAVDGNRVAISATVNGVQGIYVLQINRDLLRTTGNWGTSIGTGNVVEQVWLVPKSTASATSDYPALRGDYVAWREAPTSGTREATDKNIYLCKYTEAVPGAVRLTGTQGAPGFMIPHFAGNRVVWMDDRWGAANPQIFMYDIDTNSGYQLTNSFSQKGAVFACSEGLIVWADRRSGNWDLYAFDLNTWAESPEAARETQLTFDSYNQFNPSLGGAWVAYQDDRPNPTNNQWDVYYALFPSPPNIGVRELTGVQNDRILDLGKANLGMPKGIGFEIRNTGYDILSITGYTLNNLAGYESELTFIRYNDANKNLRLDPGETIYDANWQPGEALPDLGVEGYHSIWMTWTPTAVGQLPTNAGMTIFSNADREPEYAVAIVGTAQDEPDIAVSPAQVDVGGVPVNYTGYVEVTITNTGSRTLTVSNIVASAAPFDVVPPTGGYPLSIVPGASATFQVSFKPVQVGSFTAVVRIYSDDPDYGPTNPYTLTVRGSGVAVPDIAVQDAGGNPLTELAYGDVEIGKSKDIAVIVRNQGTAPLTLSGWQSSDPATIFLVGTLPTTAIPVGGAVNLTIRFKPTVAGDYSTGWFRLLNNDPDVVGNSWGAPVESPYTLTLQAAGITIPHLVVEESAGVVNDRKIDFGTLATSAGQVDQLFVIKNTGTETLSITSWSFVGDPQFQILGLPLIPFDLAPGATRTGTVRFTITGQGDFAGTLTLFSNDADYPAGYTLTTQCKVRTGHAATAPSTLTFGNVEIGQTSASQQFKITNTGQAPLSVTSVVSGNAAFTLVRPTGYTGAFTLQPGQSTPMFTVTFKPTQAMTYSSSIQITSDDPDNPVVSQPVLVGTGVVLPSLTVLETSGTPNDNSIDFGKVKIGQTAVQTFTIRNDGTGPLTVSAWSSNNTAFTLQPANGSGGADDIQLAPGDSLTVTITFTPFAANHSGQITILSNDTRRSPYYLQVYGQGTVQSVAADFNGDGRLDMSDMELFKTAFGSRAGEARYHVKYDLDGPDGDVDSGDLGVFLGAFYTSAAPGKQILTAKTKGDNATPSVPPAPTPAVQADVSVTAATAGSVETPKSGTDDDTHDVVEGLSFLSNIGAIPTVTIGSVDTGVQAATELTDVAAAGVDREAAELNDNASTSDLLAAATAPPVEPAAVLTVAETTEGAGSSGAAIAELSRIDAVVVPYADALLPIEA